MQDELTARITAELALALTERCCGTANRRRILADRRGMAWDVMASALRPYVPAGLWYWAVNAHVGESPRAYARRAIRCLVARCAQAGLTCQLAAQNASDVGMLAGHGSGAVRFDPVRAVTVIERAIARDEVE